jgi:hypothetical protein
MIDAFMSIKPIFQQTHSKDFMDPNDKMYNHVFPQELKGVNRHGSTMHEDFDPSPNNYPEPMYTMFNVGGSFMKIIL